MCSSAVGDIGAIGSFIAHARTDIPALLEHIRQLPQWHDRPPGPGLWACKSKPWANGPKDDVMLNLSQEDIDRGAPFQCVAVFGPIPAREETGK